MKIRTLTIAAVFVLGSAAAGFAQLSMAKADWAQGPVKYLMTKDEQAQWNALKSDADADRFIALFWARRDPTPGTPQNEFRDQFDARVTYADQHFGTARQKGSLTDRGRILILFGPPTRALRSGGPGGINKPTSPSFNATPGSAPGTEAEDTSTAEQQLWQYEGDVAQKAFGVPRAEFRFIDRAATGDFHLETPRIDMATATQRAITAAITQPNLTTVPTYQTQQPQPAAAPQPAAPAAPVTTFKTPAFETAVTNAQPSSRATASSVLFLTPGTGEPYISSGIYATGLAADAADTVFGAVTDASGKRVLAFEEPATPLASHGAVFAGKELELPPGKYTETIGLAKAGTPVVVTTAPLEIADVPKDTEGTSALILSNDLQNATTAAPVKTAYAFGQWRIIPTLTFTNKDDVNYFVEVHNPGIDPTTNGPKLQMKLDLLDSKGKPVAGAPLTSVDAGALSGKPGPGEYVVSSAIPLSQMKPLPPGEYTLKMKLIDTLSKQSYNLEQKFTIEKT